MALVGYARVSTPKQDLDEQIFALKKYGCQKIFAGKYSGKAEVSKKTLEELLRYIREGDTVVVTKIDRLGRSLSQCLQLLEIFKKKPNRFCCLRPRNRHNQKTRSYDTGIDPIIGLICRIRTQLHC